MGGGLTVTEEGLEVEGGGGGAKQSLSITVPWLPAFRWFQRGSKKTTLHVDTAADSLQLHGSIFDLTALDTLKVKCNVTPIVH